MWLSRLYGEIRPGEESPTFGAFLTLFAFMAAHALLETARDALFLSRLPASELPWVYLSIALIALVLAQIQQRLVAHLSPASELGLWLGLCSGVTFLFWVLVGWAQVWVFYALYVWSGVLATLVVVRFWTVLGSLFTLTQAKRLFAPVGSGSVLGAIAGSALAVVLASALPARHLVLAAAIVLSVSAVFPRLLTLTAETSEPGPRPRPLRQLSEVFQMVWARVYLRRVAILILISTVTFTFIDFLFKSYARRSIAAEQLDQFFSSFYLTLSLLSLLIQVMLVSRLLRRYGVQIALALAPTLLLLGAVGVMVAGGLGAVLLLKGIDGSLRHSLNRTVSELLFVSLPERTRSTVKSFIDVVGQRGGQALASLILLTALLLSR